ncbi:unnamed protein product, partial [Enterobius vermicularis]|uniref:Ground-like domain-containing protein n=1 Tax=Enterobius vermicularis TaxID=51028 RepID=A0A0N4UUA4_ENTVE
CPPPPAPVCPPPRPRCPKPSCVPFVSACEQQTPALSSNHDCCHACDEASDCSMEVGNVGMSFDSARKMKRHMHKSSRVSKRDVDGNVDLTCNSEKLKALMFINKSSSESKRDIQKAAEMEFNTKFNVICSEASFSYVAHTNVYCQTSNANVTCYAFQAN